MMGASAWRCSCFEHQRSMRAAGRHDHTSEYTSYSSLVRGHFTVNALDRSPRAVRTFRLAFLVLVHISFVLKGTQLEAASCRRFLTWSGRQLHTRITMDLRMIYGGPRVRWSRRNVPARCDLRCVQRRSRTCQRRRRADGHRRRVRGRRPQRVSIRGVVCRAFSVASVMNKRLVPTSSRESDHRECTLTARLPDPMTQACFRAVREARPCGTRIPRRAPTGRAC
jgi:hypothetical protein